MYQKVRNFFLDFLFPIECLDCGASGEWICSQCLIKIKPNSLADLGCPFCGQKNTQGLVCSDCGDQHYLNGVWVVSSYHCQVLKKAINHLKYDFVQSLAEPLGKLLEEFLSSVAGEYSAALIIPTPLHIKRFKARGFNQSALLAQAVARSLGDEIAVDVLKRQKNTSAQAKLGQTKRHANVAGAFQISQPAKVRGKDIILVDDVLTTGSTLDECARVLHEAGAKKIWAIVLAKG